MKPDADPQSRDLLSYSVETSQQLSRALLVLKLAGVPARCAVRDQVLLIDIHDTRGHGELELFDFVRRAAPSAQRAT